MANLQIKDLPESLHAELRRRAHLEGVTVRAYVLDLIQRDQVQPARSEWFERVGRLTAVEVDGPVADVVRADRESRSGA